jgi:2'-5' RNA ligase
MYSKDHSYLFTSFASDDVQKKVLDIRKKIGVLPYVGGTADDDIITKNFAHVTIKGSFSLKENMTEEKELELVNTLNFPPLEVVGKKYEIYETKELGVILVVSIEQNPDLQKLHMDIWNLLGDFIENSDPNFIWEQNMFTPHMSVIYHLDTEKKDEAVKLLEDILPLSFTLDSMLFLGNNPGIRHTRKVLKEIYAK